MTPAHDGSASLEWWRPAPAAAAAERHRRAWGTLPFLSLLAFTGILLLAPQTLWPPLASLRIALLAGGLAVVSHVYGAIATGRPWARLDRPTLLALALAGWAVLTVPLSRWPGGSVSLLLGIYFKALVVFWLLGSVVDTRARLVRACWTFALLMLPLAATGIRNYLAGQFVEGAQPVDRIIGYDAPLTQNPNDLALMLNLGLPLGVGLLLASRGSLRRAVLALGIFGSACAIVLTFSRAGFLCLGGTVAVYLWKLLRRGRWGIVLSVAGVLSLGLLCLPEGYSARLATISDIEADPTRSAQLRWTDIVESTRMVQANPLLGAGIGMNVLALNEARGPAWKEVHNAYLQYGVDLGLPGLGLFAALLLSCLHDVARVRRRCAEDPGRRDLLHLAEGLQVSLLAFAGAAMFQPVAYQFYFFYVGGLAVASRRISEAEMEPAP